MIARFIRSTNSTDSDMATTTGSIMLSSEEDSSRGSEDPSDPDEGSGFTNRRRVSASTVVRQPTVAATEGSPGPSATNSRVMKIRVQIDDEVLLIPCPAGEARTVSWLVEEAGTRYRANMGAKVCDRC